uniref:hypothetical protein n=1 Tax=uncultured Erythrobacter sp. TaxID=263913 RepID=UPI0026146F2B|nr:hypothetical protein [uncultured Erythrobacter sp.]
MTDPETKDTASQERSAPQKKGTLLPLSPNPATNLVIADIVVRGASSLFRKGVEQKVAEKTAHDQNEARQVLDGRGIVTTLGLYGASKLATRSPVGLGIVAGGLVLKTLYDRGKDRQRRLRKRSK